MGLLLGDVPVEISGLESSLGPHGRIVGGHTAASLAIASGATVLAVSQMLGHASAKMTLDIYAGLFETHMDEVAERLNERAMAPCPVCAHSAQRGGAVE
jgi:site-specific recombinase XerD